MIRDWPPEIQRAARRRIVTGRRVWRAFHMTQHAVNHDLDIFENTVGSIEQRAVPCAEHREGAFRRLWETR